MTRRIPLAVLLLLLVAWPMTYRYTSLGIDSDATDGSDVVSTYYRLRWPGNGIMMIGYLVERHPHRGMPIEAFDLGGTFLEPSRATPAVSRANRVGFWFIDVDPDRGDGFSPMAPHAQRAVLIGFPHWLLVVTASAWCAFRGRLAGRGKTEAVAGK
ncbi:MAG TPA: hypothetical protein VF595_14900 [Tepidisphaeraceae bacterium]|jgi:hypothetical protein